MRHVLATLLFLIVLVSPAMAQNMDILGTIDEILNSISDLKNQLDGITVQIDEQAERLSNLDATLGQIFERWPEIEQSAAFIENLRGQLTPLIEKVPQIENQLQSLDTIQAGLSERYETLNSSLSEMSSSLSLNSGDEIAALEAELESLNTALTTRDSELASLQEQLSGFRLLVYIAIALIVGLALLQLSSGLRRKQSSQ